MYNKVMLTQEIHLQERSRGGALIFTCTISDSLSNLSPV